MPIVKKNVLFTLLLVQYEKPKMSTPPFYL